jgi:hypothetical protein
MSDIERKVKNSELSKLKDFMIDKNKPLGKILFGIFNNYTNEIDCKFPYDNVICSKSKEFGFGLRLSKFKPGYWDNDWPKWDVYKDLALSGKPKMVQEQCKFGFLELLIFKDYLDAINYQSGYDLALFSLENKKTILGYYRNGLDLEGAFDPKFAVFLARIEGEITGRIQSIIWV